MEPDPGSMAASSEEPGVSLLRPAEDLESFRRKAELPSRVGRYVLVGLGAVILGAGAGLWFSHPSPVADGLLVFGLLLVLLGFVQHHLLLRDRAHWPTQAMLWAEGLELVLTNGEIRAAVWSDPKFVLDLYARPVDHDGQYEYVLVWKMDPKVPMCPITAEGFEQVRETAVTRGLEFSEYASDNRRHTLRGFEIRPPPSSRDHGGLASEPAQAAP